jgi:hypothetical protein
MRALGETLVVTYFLGPAAAGLWLSMDIVLGLALLTVLKLRKKNP